MRIYQRKKIWYIDYLFNGNRMRKKVGTSRKMAELALKEVELKIAKGEFLGVNDEKPMTFEELVEEYLKYSKANKRFQVFRRDLVVIKHLAKKFKHKNINSIFAYDVEQYKNTRLNDVSPATVNRELTCINNMLNKAVEWGHLKYNKIRIVKKLKEPPGRVRYLINEEIERLLSYCNGHIKFIVMVALNTGMRKGEILDLKWSDVDMRNRVITLKRTKNNEIRILPINEVLYELLKDIASRNGKGYIFANAAGMPYREIKTGFMGALRRAEIHDFRFHDLRHTFASRLVMAGVDIRTVQELMGHKDIKMTMRYSHLSDSHLKDAVRKLEPVKDKA